MFDTVVLLTPLLILIIALLFGFAGCGFTGLSTPLSAVARVPTELTVTRIQFDWTDPDNHEGMFWQDDPPSSDTEDGNDVFVYEMQRFSPGGWTVRCQINARDSTGASATDADECAFVLDPSRTDPRVNFQASGTPAGLNFAVTCTGLT